MLLVGYNGQASVSGLRVIDCSIIPQVPSGNTDAITMAIGEKGSDLVLQSRRGGA